MLALVAGATLVGFGMKSVVFCSRLVMGYFFVLNTGMIWLVHLFIRNRERFFGWSKRRETNLLIVTTREYVEKILKRFGESKEINWIVTGIVLLEDTKGESQWNGIPVFGETDDYLEYATLHVVDEVFIQVDEIQKREKYLKNMILEFEKRESWWNLNLDLFDLGVNGVKTGIQSGAISCAGIFQSVVRLPNGADQTDDRYCRCTGWSSDYWNRGNRAGTIFAVRVPRTIDLLSESCWRKRKNLQVL